MGLYSEQNSYKHSTQTMRLRWGACDNTVWLLYFTCSTPQQCTAMMLLNKCHVFLISAWSYSNIDECAQLMKYSCFYEECGGDSDPGTTAKYHGMTNTVSHMAHIWEACRSIQVKNLHLGGTSLGRSTPVYYPSYQQCQLPPYHMKPPQRKELAIKSVLAEFVCPGTAQPLWHRQCISGTREELPPCLWTATRWCWFYQVHQLPLTLTSLRCHRSVSSVTEWVASNNHPAVK